ncbi:MAG: flagellar biosynthesis anti-sigma factor FlgM [Janthinobacterium lividum]
MTNIELTDAKNTLNTSTPTSRLVSVAHRTATRGMAGMQRNMRVMQVKQPETPLASLPVDPDVRMDKVNALRAAILNGTYYVPASALAEKLIESLTGRS